ncbi:MAG: hypothetical protein Ct9H300mP7_5780 [Verrucomicrobiota bacterium]|nr:MAG: hypothetical protein Ct9H300mP7_5780 [Verrucomicrobiota bacterium]
MPIMTTRGLRIMPLVSLSAETGQAVLFGLRIFPGPHLPWYVPKKFFDLYPLAEVKVPESPLDDLDDVPPAGRKFAQRVAAIGDYSQVG